MRTDRIPQAGFGEPLARASLSLPFCQWNLDYAKHTLKCHGDVYTLSQGFVCIKIILLNQLAEF